MSRHFVVAIAASVCVACGGDGARCSQDEDCASGLSCKPDKCPTGPGECRHSCTRDDDCTTGGVCHIVCAGGSVQRGWCW